MRHPVLALCIPLLAGCRPAPPAQDPQHNAPGSPAEPTGEAPQHPAPAEPLPPGAFASAPLQDWPCGAELEVQDGGGIESIQFTYGRRDACIIPGDLMPGGVVGCPTSKTVRRLGDDDPLYTIRYEYDENGRLVGTQENEAAPERYSWGEALVHDRTVEQLTYESGEGGFVIRDLNGLRAEADVAGDKLTRVTRTYPKIRMQIEITLKWEGERLISVDSGGDEVVFDYGCRDASRT